MPQHATHATHPIRILMSISLFIIRLQLIISNLRAKNANNCIPDAYPIHTGKRVGADLHFLCAKMHIRTHFCVTLPRIKYHILCLH